MFRIDNPSAVSTLPVVPTVGLPGYFSKGNPATGISATIVDDWWLNTVQEEIATVIVNAGITLSKTDRTQLYQAIQHLISIGDVGGGGGTGGGPYLLLTGGQLYPPGAADPLTLYVDAGHNNRIIYTSGITRQWAQGLDPSGNWVVVDNTAGQERLTIDLSGQTVVLGNFVVALGATVDGSLTVQGHGQFNGPFNVGGVAGFANDLTVAGNLGCNNITINGNIGDGGTVGVAGSLTVSGNIGGNNITAGGNMGVGLVLSVSGNANIAGDVHCNQLYTASDERFKGEIEQLDLDVMLDGIKALRPVSYLLRESAERSFGFLASDVAATPLKDAVHHNDADGFDYVSYSHLLAAAIGAIQRLDTRLDALGG